MGDLYYIKPKSVMTKLKINNQLRMTTNNICHIKSRAQAMSIVRANAVMPTKILLSSMVPSIPLTSEVLSLSDGRLGLLTLPVLIALGWVGFSILGPALNQLNTMSEKQRSK